jgi:hypothetical protein
MQAIRWKDDADLARASAGEGPSISRETLCKWELLRESVG